MPQNDLPASLPHEVQEAIEERDQAKGLSLQGKDRDIVELLRETLGDVINAHRMRESAQYNECENAQCAWCDSAFELLSTIPALLAARAERVKAFADTLSAHREIAREMRSEAKQWRGLDPVNNRTARQLETFADKLDPPAHKEKVIPLEKV